MKKLLSTLFLAATFAGSVALAGPIPATGTVKFTSTGSNGNGSSGANGSSLGGGEFDALLGNGDTILTFCIEYKEQISLGTTYNYDATSPLTAIEGGLSDTDTAPDDPAGDPISKGSAALVKLATVNADYWTFLGAGIGSNDEAAGWLQKAIWVLEGEAPNASTLATWTGEANPYFTYLTSLGFTGLGTSAGEAGEDYAGSSVVVINPFTGADIDNPGTHKQSQIAFVPDGGLTLLMLGGALSVLAVVRRRK